MHFETIWNEAESVAKSYSDLNHKKIIRNIRTSIEDLSDGENIEELHSAMGDILFNLCEFCAYLEEKCNLELNSATALQQSIEQNRIKLLNQKSKE